MTGQKEWIEIKNEIEIKIPTGKNKFGGSNYSPLAINSFASYLHNDYMIGQKELIEMKNEIEIEVKIRQERTQAGIIFHWILAISS